MKQYVPPEQLWSADWGGDMDFEYDHAVYWPALNDMCRRRREEKTRRWEAAGKEVGESEVYLSGGTDKSAKGFTYVAGEEEKKKEDDGVSAVEEKLAEAKLEDTKVAANPADAAAAAAA